MKSHSSNAAGIRWRNRAAVALCLFSLLAMAGDIIGSRIVKGLGAVSACAPFPKVFCKFEGMEGFACDFIVRFETGGTTHDVAITPELYSRLSGPYNRRNVYGAALAGGPKLPRPIWEAVFRHGFAKDGPLRREFGLPADAENIRVLVRSKSRDCRDEWLLQPEE